MSYGFVSRNASDEIVIDSEYPSLVKISTGQMIATNIFLPTVLQKDSNSSPTLYKFQTIYNAPQFDIGTELLAFPLSVGDFVSLHANGEFGFPVHVCAETSDFVIVGSRARLPSPDGNGVALYGSNGDTHWSTETELGFLVDAGSIRHELLQDEIIVVNPDFTHLIINQQLLGRAQVSSSEFAFISFGISRVSANTLRTMRVLHSASSIVSGAFDFGVSDIRFITAKL